MKKSLALNKKQKHDIVNIEDAAMSVDKVLSQIALIQNVMKQAMKKDEHYGVIPGTQKPTLLKSGAEKLCLTFRLDPRYDIIADIRDTNFIAYTAKCTLIHIPTSVEIATGIGSCNSRETKYRYRYTEESTGKPIPKEYWKAKKGGNNKEMKRILGGEGFRAAKIDGQWVIAKSKKIENDNPWDLDNTLVKMACKRALVAATLNATAASDIFTQDLEELPRKFNDNSHTEKTEDQPDKKDPKQEKYAAQLANLKNDIHKKILTSPLLSDFEKWMIATEIENYTVELCKKCLERYSDKNDDMKTRLTFHRQDKKNGTDTLAKYLIGTDNKLKEAYELCWESYQKDLKEKEAGGKDEDAKEPEN